MQTSQLLCLAPGGFAGVDRPRRHFSSRIGVTPTFDLVRIGDLSLEADQVELDERERKAGAHLELIGVRPVADALGPTGDDCGHAGDTASDPPLALSKPVATPSPTDRVIDGTALYAGLAGRAVERAARRHRR
jgi:hypothetical protein